MEVRKCCQHPFLLDGVEEAFAQQAFKAANHRHECATRGSSGKLQLLDKLLPRLKGGGHRVLIFSQMTRVLDVLEDYSRSRGHSYERLDGASPVARDKPPSILLRPRAARETKRRGVCLLSTRAGGQGINLVAADTVIVFDSDWNPQNDAQALRARTASADQTRAGVSPVMRGTTSATCSKAAMKLGLEQAISAAGRGETRGWRLESEPR